MVRQKGALTTDLFIDKEKFKIAITDLFSGIFTYGIHSWVAIISDNSTTKDTLLERDILKTGEVLKRGSNHYRFENISNNGEYITLVKELNFPNLIGTQIGVIAPEFACKTVAGDTINSSTLHDRIIVIANSCSCGGNQISTKSYYDMKKEYGSIIHIFRLDSNIEKGSEGLQIDVAEKFNNDMYNKYRQEYCSRECFVIGKNNRIIDKFPVNNWKYNLPKYVKF